MTDKRLKSQLKRGVLSTAAAKYSDYALALVVSAVLARLLTPAEFGTVAVITVLVAFFQLLGNVGLGAAVIQHRELSDSELKSIFSLSFLIGVIFSIIFWAASPVIADFYENEEYLSLIPVLSLTLIFNIISVVPQAVLRRNHRFLGLGIIIIVSHVIGGIAGILCAFYGLGPMALVIKSGVASGLIFIISYFMAGLPLGFSLNKEVYGRIFKFTSFQFLFQFINYFTRNLDKLLIGKILGQESLGYYEKSYRLMMLPLHTLTHVISPVLHPVLSTVKDEKEKIFKGLIKVSQILAIIGFPLAVFLSFSANEIVLIIFGNQWENSVPVFSILAWSVGLQMVSSSLGGGFQASERTDLLFISGVISAVIMITLMILGLLTGETKNVAIALVIAFSLNFFQSTFFLIVLTLKQNYLFFLRKLMSPLFSAISLFAVFFLLFNVLNISVSNIYLFIFFKILIAAVVFICVSVITGTWKILKEIF